MQRGKLEGGLESSKTGGAEAETATGEIVSKPEVVKLFSAFVSVPRPSRSKLTSDGKIQHFSSGRSRSSDSKGSSGGVGNNGWINAELYLTDTMLCYEIVPSEKQICEILLEDLIGIHIGHASVSNVKTCQLAVHYFPLVTKRWAKKKMRRLVETSVLFDKEKEYEDNVRAAGEWKTRIIIQAERATKCIFEQGDVDQQVCSGGAEVCEEQGVCPRNLLVFINPMAGTQKGARAFSQYIKPMFDLAEIKYVTMVTDHHNDAYELIQEMELKRFTGIVIASGDGLLHEVINGLMMRTDWEEVIKIPIGMIPTGSGNALAASTLYESMEHFSLETAAFQIIRGGLTPLDLATVHTSDGNSIYMALLASWGIVADIDIESENMRKLGEARFTLGALNSIRKKRVYKGKMSYLVADNACQEPERMILQPQFLTEPSEEVTELDDRKNGLKPTGTEAVGESSPGDGSGDLHKDNSMPDGGSQNGCVDSKSHGSAGEGASATCSQSETLETSAAYVQSETPVALALSPLKVTPFGPPADLLVPLGDPLPDTWVTKDEAFLGVVPLMIPHLSRTTFGDPNFQIGTGKIRLMWIDGSMTKFGALKMFKNADTGKHIEMEEVKLVDAKAFRIDPATPNGIMTVDGEKISYGPMQAQIHPHLARVMSRKRRS